MLEAVIAASMSAKAAATPVAQLKAPAYRLEVVDRAQRGPGEEPLARPRAVILRPLLEPLLVHRIGFGGEDDLARTHRSPATTAGDLRCLGARAGEEPGRGVERFDLLGIAGDIRGGKNTG